MASSTGNTYAHIDIMGEYNCDILDWWSDWASSPITARLKTSATTTLDPEFVLNLVDESESSSVLRITGTSTDTFT